MRRAPLLALFAILASAPLATAENVFPELLLARPLGVLVCNHSTILVLRVKSVSEEGVVFETKETLKGQAIDTPFRPSKPLKNLRSDDLLHVGDLAVCFSGPTLEYDPAAILYVGGRWVVASQASAQHGGGWSYYADPWRDDPRLAVVYAGSFAELREHVKAIVAGREVTITARAPKLWDARGGARLWRIKAGPNVTNFCLSDESPLFVGWGTGDPKEVEKLVKALETGTPHERISAADDLGNLGAAARSARPDLRRVVRDAEPKVALAAAKAIARLDADDTNTVEAIAKRLGDKEEGQRLLTADALRDLGPRGRAAVPALLRALRDDSAAVRGRAAAAVGEVAPDSAAAREAVTALADLLQGEQEGTVRSAVIQALGRFGPAAAPALPAVCHTLSAPDDPHSWPDPPKADAFDLLAHFDPPPVEWLADVLTDPDRTDRVRSEAARTLVALGPRARAALPALWQAWDKELHPDKKNHSPNLDIAEALLNVDPLGAPALLTPNLVKVCSPTDLNDVQVLMLLGRCGAVGRREVPALLLALDRKEPLDTWRAQSLIALLGPEHREQLPALRKLLDHPANDHYLAEALWRLGYREEALAAFSRCLENKHYYPRLATIRWLGEHPREAQELAPALRKARDQATKEERARLDLTLWRADGGKGTERRIRALTALDELLAVSDDGPPLHYGTFYQLKFWSEGAPWTSPQEDTAVGNAVSQVLARLDASDNTLAVLTDLLQDRSPYVRLAAAVALASAEPKHPETVPALQRLLSKQPHLLCYAADTLVALGPTAAPLAPLLMPLLRHPGVSLHDLADRVLRRIDPKFTAKGWGADVPDDLGPLWDDLAHTDAFRADLAVWKLTAAGPRAVALLRERLQSPPSPHAETIAQWIAELDDNDFATRQRASTAITEAIEAAAPALRGALAGEPTAEQRRRLKQLLVDLDRGGGPEQRRRLRAVRLLEEIGGPDARTLLSSLADGDPRFALTREAGAALSRLERGLPTASRPLRVYRRR